MADKPAAILKQEAFEKCWAHSPLRAVLHCHSPGVATVARRLRIDVHDDDDDNNDNARHWGPLWPHGMGPKIEKKTPKLSATDWPILTKFDTVILLGAPYQDSHFFIFYFLIVLSTFVVNKRYIFHMTRVVHCAHSMWP